MIPNTANGPNMTYPITEKTREMDAEYRVLSTKALSASFNSLPLLTTVPIGVAKQFKPNGGDQLDWTIEARDGKLIIVVAPHKAKK